MPCVTIKFIACAPSTDKLLPWVYPKVDYRLAFVDSGTPGRGCAYSFPDEQDGHHPDFAAVAGGFTFIISFNNFTTTTTEEA